MSLHVTLLPVQISADTIVVIDVLRFTSSAAYALANGARSITPCATIEEVRSPVSHLQSPISLLAGERHGLKPPGFDHGNSPLEFTREAVQGRDIIWTTTNGTRAIATALRGNGPRQEPSASTPHPAHSTPPPIPNPRTPPPAPGSSSDLILSSYVNLRAVASFLEPRLRAGSTVAIICSGSEGGVSLEDSACAGRLVNALVARIGDVLTMNDGARASACIDEAYGEDIPRLFRDAQHGRFLRDHGFGADLEACGALDAVQVVPRWRDGRFVAG